MSLDRISQFFYINFSVWTKLAPGIWQFLLLLWVGVSFHVRVMCGGHEPFSHTSEPHPCLPGVHWGYEETKTFLDILRETRFYEALQACHRKSKLYGAVAERLRECGFLRTPEQCRTKFKSLQKSYRKARSGHVLESCAFFEDMDALLNPAARTSSAGKPKETASLPRPKRVGAGAEEQISLVEEEEAAEESGGEEMGIEFLRKAGLRAAPVLFQNLSGKGRAFVPGLKVDDLISWMRRPRSDQTRGAGMHTSPLITVTGHVP